MKTKGGDSRRNIAMPFGVENLGSLQQNENRRFSQKLSTLKLY